MNADLLHALSRDLAWASHPSAHELWRSADPFLWEALNHNPVALLAEIDVGKLPEAWHRQMATLARTLAADSTRPLLRDVPRVAYFCMEYGIHESLPIYSGGLGMLAGDHLRSASDLGLDLIAVGMFWREGYFRQSLHGGRQAAAYAPNDPANLAMEPVYKPGTQERLVLTVPNGTRLMAAQAWKVKVGRVTLYLLDTDVPGAPDEDRALTRRLYGGRNGDRIRQEVVLGIGGVRLLEALGIERDVFHMNEGHSAFLVFELWAQGLRLGKDPRAAFEAARQRCVFTTHTPVEAGHDRFDWHTADPVLGAWRHDLGLPLGSFMDRGRVRPSDVDEPLCMTVLGMRGSRAINAVSALHGEVTRQMWASLKMPIQAITNGVHPTAWLAPETEALWDRYLIGWRDHFEDADFWRRAEHIPTEALLATRDARRQRLVREVRRLVGRDVLDPHKVTIGFARRFAPYKRGNLLFRDPHRLEAILEAGFQVVFAGKAHPADAGGQAIIADVLRWSRKPRFRDQIVFVPDYDMHIGRLLTGCADIWLNNPRRPYEASGTSGQKAALNGNLNLSILDGWWPEAADGTNGWSIGAPTDRPDSEAFDGEDANALYEVLEQQVVPAAADPAGWARKMARAMSTCAPAFNTHRMVRDYLGQLYRTG
jgi:alpha-glucan phosphorylase-like protein